MTLTKTVKAAGAVALIASGAALKTVTESAKYQKKPVVDAVASAEEVQ